jgi:sugar lactone lactonase YvrE
MTDVEVAVAAQATIGESPTWSPTEQAIYWIDVKEPALHRYHPGTGAVRSWSLPSDVGAFALCRDDAAVVALRHGLYRLDLLTDCLDLIEPPPFDPTLFRFNDGVCDHTGRFWVGVMFDPLDKAAPPQRGYLHSFTFQEGLRREDDHAELHNGMAIGHGGTRFFLSHSNEGAIYVFDFDAMTGTLGSRSKFAQIPSGLGLPDGAAIDSEGCYWCAVHGAGCLHRYRPDGTLDREVLLPVSKPTMCTFAGADLDTLYVTSAAEGVDLVNEALAGALLRFSPGVKGVARSCKVS